MKLFDWLRSRREPKGDLAPAPSSQEEARLEAKLQTVQRDTELEPDDWSAIDRLLGQGREHEVIEILRRWIVARPSDFDATLRLCELLCGRLEHAGARPLLERLVKSPPHRLRALMLLGEAAERLGDLLAARRAYETILATDLDHVRARAAADRLRPPPAPRTLDAPLVDETRAPAGGRYRLERELGRGASGSVYLADDVQLERAVALKILHPRARDATGEVRARAWDEARIAAALRHPGVIAIYDLDEERQLIAMELCRGGSLRDRLSFGPLSPPQALSAIAQLASALEIAHARGIVHGDIKPGNLLLRNALGDALAPLSNDELVLCDFGIARLADDGQALSAQLGTLAYMAPEQRRGELSPAADLYSAGLVLRELLVGATEIDRAALLRGDVPASTTFPPDLTARLGARANEIAALLTTLLASDPHARPTAAVLARTARALQA
jgi:hypothetical protein